MGAESLSTVGVLEVKFYEEFSLGNCTCAICGGKHKVLCPTDASENQMDPQYGNVVNKDLIYDFNDLM